MPERATTPPAVKIALVAWREFRHTALTKGFLIGAVAVPLVLFGLMAVIPLLVSRETPPLVGRIAISDPSGTLASRIDAALRAPPPSLVEAADELAREAERDPTRALAAAGDLRAAGDLAAPPPVVDVEFVEFAASAPGLEESTREALRTGRLLAAISVSAEALDPSRDAGEFRLLVPNSLPPKHVMMISDAAQRALEAERIARSGVDPALVERLARPPAPETTRISPEGAATAERTELRLLIPAAFMMLVFVSVFSSANYLLTTTIEEKSSKVMEVLLAAVSPMQLLSGKIAGYALVTLVILAMYGGLSLAGLSVLALLDLVKFEHLAYLVIYLAMAYLMLASMMAAIGSAVSDLNEAQSLLGPVMTALILPLILAGIIIDDPNGVLATVTSFIPPLAPFIMIIRLTASNEPVALWQTALSIGWGFACAIGMTWVAARVFRVGILMQGKPPTPRELLRWAFVR